MTFIFNLIKYVQLAMLDIQIVRLLLQQPNIDLNKIDYWNTTALGIATENNHTDVIQLLKDTGAQ